jgi:hypothetical protein
MRATSYKVRRAAAASLRSMVVRRRLSSAASPKPSFSCSRSTSASASSRSMYARISGSIGSLSCFHSNQHRLSESSMHTTSGRQ